MQDEVNEKVVSLAIKTSKLTAEDPKNDCPIRQRGKRHGKAYRTGVAESNQEVFGAEKQSPAWETDHAAAYEAGRKGFQH